MADNCYYKMLGEEFGPVSREFLEELVRSGQLGPTDVVRMGEHGGWRPASAVVVTSVASTATATSQDKYTPGGTRGLFSAVNEQASRSGSQAEEKTPGVDEFMDLSELEIVEDAPPPVKSRPAAEIPTPPPPSKAFSSRTSGPATTSPNPAPRQTSASTLGTSSAPSRVPAAPVSSPPSDRPNPPPQNTPAPVPSASDEWYCEMLGQQLGPFALADLKSRFAAGELTPQTRVRQGTSGNWIALSTLAGVTGSGVFAPIPAPANLPAQPTPLPVAVPAAYVPVPVIPMAASPIGYTPQAIAPPAWTAPAAATPAAIDTDRVWYCYTNDKQYGPITLEVLAKWAKEGRLKKTDHVKLGAEGEWFTAGDVEELFGEKEDKAALSGGVKVADIRVQSAEEYAAQREQREADIAKNSTSSSDATSRAAQQQQNKLPPLISREFNLSASKAKAESFQLDKRHVLIGLVALVAIGLGVSYMGNLSKMLGLGNSRDMAVWQKLTKHYSDLKSFRTKKDPSGWDKYAEESSKSIKAIADSLKSSAGAANPARQQLLYAARDHWPAMVKDAKEGESPTEKKFTQALSTARKILQKK